jgi:hypothetical protein
MPIDLGAVGALGSFQHSASVSGAVGAFKELVRATASSKARSLCGDCDQDVKTATFGLKDSVGTDVTWEPGLFSVGGSAFFRSAQCNATADCAARTYSYSCSLEFSIKDWFRDPLDVGLEVPGCKPYRINANWSDSLSGGGGF